MESDSNNISNTLPIEQSNYISHESSPNTNYYSEHSNGAKMLPIPKTDMNTLFIKLKSNSHFKTIKDPEENAKKEFLDIVKDELPFIEVCPSGMNTLLFLIIAAIIIPRKPR